MENNHLFRTVVFGGFNKDDVIDYIETMRNDFHSYRQQVEETISGLKKKIRDLESIGLSLPIENDSQSFEIPTEAIDSSSKQILSSVSEINEATEQLRKTADLLCSSLGDFISKISENSLSVNVAFSETEEDNNDVLASDLHEALVENILKDEEKIEAEEAPTEEASEPKSFFDDIISQAKVSEKNTEKAADAPSGSGSILDGILSSAFVSN
ncbi:MAG: hypothetical protein IJ262_07310 [Clostridia bacterium]|nr:hypothetical protein [Clostridia bacterium]